MNDDDVIEDGVFGLVDIYDSGEDGKGDNWDWNPKAYAKHQAGTHDLSVPKLAVMIASTNCTVFRIMSTPTSLIEPLQRCPNW